MYTLIGFSGYSPAVTPPTKTIDNNPMTQIICMKHLFFITSSTPFKVYDDGFL
jgi:hypothetical protein